MRYLSVTENGYLVIYEDNVQGLVIDLREVRNVICNADRQVEIPKKESQVSLRWSADALRQKMGFLGHQGAEI